MPKIITVYYSRKGENYWNGGVKSLKKGNTEIVAEFIQKAVGGDLFEVETVTYFYGHSFMRIENFLDFALRKWVMHL